MAKMVWYKYTFNDGYNVCCGKMSALELKVEESKHGKLVKKEVLGKI